MVTRPLSSDALAKAEAHRLEAAANDSRSAPAEGPATDPPLLTDEVFAPPTRTGRAVRTRPLGAFAAGVALASGVALVLVLMLRPTAGPAAETTAGPTAGTTAAPVRAAETPAAPRTAPAAAPSRPPTTAGAPACMPAVAALGLCDAAPPGPPPGARP